MGTAVGKFPVVPVPSPWSEGFWLALKDHQLAIQSCEDCGLLEHPPTVCCPDCGSFSRIWKPVAGTGVVYSYIVCHHPTHPALADVVPYNVAAIDLDEGVRIVSSIILETGHEDLRDCIGKRVKVEYLDTDGYVLPVFRIEEQTMRLIRSTEVNVEDGSRAW